MAVTKRLRKSTYRRQNGLGLMISETSACGHLPLKFLGYNEDCIQWGACG